MSVCVCVSVCVGIVWALILLPCCGSTPLLSSLSLTLLFLSMYSLSHFQFRRFVLVGSVVQLFKWPPIWGSHNLQIYENMKIRLAVFRNDSVCVCVCTCKSFNTQLMAMDSLLAIGVSYFAAYWMFKVHNDIHKLLWALKTKTNCPKI